MSYLDTIVALATPQGQGGIGIIRISGPLTSKISYKLLNKLPLPRQATYTSLYDYNQKNILDNVITIFFPKPNSFTGEDILEIHGHGGPIILEIIIQNVLKVSKKYIRLALPGEFSERAFINGKIDLIQAEAIAELISAKSYQAAKIASNTLQGNFSKKIHTLEERLSNLRINIESNIDFSEEHLETSNLQIIKKEINEIINEIKQIYKNAKESNLIQKGLKIVITGKPNSGKSSLFNILSEQEKAIVTPIAGTTRDTLYEFIQLNGILIHIVDTAGLYDDSTKRKMNEIEKISIKRAWNEIKQANHILLVTDMNNTNHIEEYNQLQLIIKKKFNQNKNETPITIIKNKVDLTNKKPNIIHINKQTIITISAKYNQGINLIKEHLKNTIQFLNYTKEYFTIQQRHIDILESSYHNLLKAKKIINFYLIKNDNNQLEYEILAEELRYAHSTLSKITGKFNSNTFLKKIFSKFCIGK